MVEITQHAYDRAKERLRWKRNVLDKMAEKAFYEGLTHSEMKGQLKKYISKLWFQYRTANNVRIYGENIFFFSNMTLITIYRLPNNFIRFLKY